MQYETECESGTTLRGLAMSLLNAWVTPGEAVLAVDTDGVSQAGARRAMSKVLLIPHLPAALGFRGQGAFSAGVFERCISSGFDTFDGMADALPGFLDDVELWLPEHLRVVGYGDVRNEVFAVGWSHARSRMLGRLHSKPEGAQRYHGRDSEGCLAPWIEASMSSIPKTVQSVERIAQAQVRWMRSSIGLGGGKLIVCRVTKDAVTMNHVVNFEDERMAA